MTDNEIIKGFLCDFKNCRHNCNGKCLSRVKYNRCDYRKVKIKAIKEFAGKLKTKISTATVYGAGVYYKKGYILPEAVDNLVKEMTEETNDKQET